MSTFADAVEKFEAVQEKYGKFGAWDTEPRGVFTELIEKKFESLFLHESADVDVPTTAEGWQLFSDMPGAGAAARAMTSAARNVLAAADTDRNGFVSHVKSQGWRSDWEIEQVLEDISKDAGKPVPLTEDVVSIPAKGPFPEDPSELPTIPLKNGIPGLVPPGTHVFKPHDTLVKIGYKNDEPNTVQTFDWDTQQWGRSMSVRAGQGKELLDTVSALPPAERKVPEQTAATYGHATGACLMCGTALSGTESLSRGYGPRCAGKVK